MTSNITSRRHGVNGSLATKVPCKSATTANITLEGEQTIDGVALVSGDRILVKDQTTGSENGVYAVSTSSWQREPDWDGNRDVAKGTHVYVTDGSTTFGGWRVTASNPIVVGTTDITFDFSELDPTLRSQLADTSTDGPNGFHLVYFPPLSGETGVVNLEYYYGNLLRNGTNTTPGTTDMTTAINNAVLSGYEIYVPGEDFFTTLTFLKGSYAGSGRILNADRVLYDGRNSQAYLGVNLSNDAEARLVSKGLKGSLKSSIRLSDDVYTVFSHRGGDNWLEQLLSNSGEVSSGVDSPWKVTQQKLFVASGWQAAKDAADAGTITVLSSGDPDKYPGHQYKQATHSAAERRYLTWNATFGGDLSLMFESNTDRGYVSVSIDKVTAVISAATQANPCVLTVTSHGFSDGDTIRVDEILGMTELNGRTFTVANSATNTIELSGEDATGHTAYSSAGEAGTVDAVVDLYSASIAYRGESLVKRRIAKAAHTVIAETLIEKNASSSNTKLTVTCFRIDNGDIEPHGDLFYPKPWVAGETSRAYEEVQGPTGRFYYTVAGGVNGSTTPPVHTSGSVSDGTVTWAAQTKTSFSDKYTTFQIAGSEMEYAYRFDYASGGFQDVGGNNHGNEYVSGITVLINQTEQTMAEGENYVGDMISIRQDIIDYYGVYASKTNIANATQIHEFDSKSMRVVTDFDWLVAGDVGYFYSAMWPMLVYATVTTAKVLVTASSPRRKFVFADYELDATNPIVGNAKDSWLQVEGRLYVEEGSAGVPTSDNGPIGFTLGLKADMAGMDHFNNSNDINCGMAMNTNAGEYTGVVPWNAKLYFQYATANNPISITASDSLGHSATYYTVITDNHHDVSSL